MPTIAVVNAGLSEPSSSRLLADRLAESAVAALAASAEGSVAPGALESPTPSGAVDGAPVEVVHIDLRPLAHEVTDALLTRFAPPALEAAVRRVVTADAFIFVTPIFTAGMSGLAKSFLDIVEPDSLRALPVLIGATGGTSRHSLSIEHGVRPVFSYLGAAVVPTAVFAATDDWGSVDERASLDGRIVRAGEDLAWAIRSSRRVVPSEEPESTDFGSLLDSLGQ